MKWDLFCRARGTANRLYAAVKARYSSDCRRNLDDWASANAFWRTLKGHAFVRLVVRLFLISRGRLSCWVRGLTASSHETLSSVILGRHSVALPSERVRLSGTCWILIRMVVWTRLVASLCFFQKTASGVTPKLSCLFRRLLHYGEFLLEWRIADATPIPKGLLSALVCKYIGRFRLHQFCQRFSKGWSLCVLVVYWSTHTGRVWVQVLIQKSLGTCDALLDIVCACQMELNMGLELPLVQINFSAAFDRVNHGDLVSELQEAGVGGMILKVFQNFLSSRTQRVKV